MAFRKHSGLLELIDSPYTKYLLKLFYVPHTVWDSSDVKVKKASFLPPQSLLLSRGGDRRVEEIKHYNPV